MRIVARVAVVIALLAVALTGGFSGFAASAQAAGAKAEGDNPAPFINALSPSAAAIGGPDFTLTVDGSGFVPGSQVRWNGEPRPTTYLSAGQLTAQIGAADIAAAQTASVTVFNPLPGGGVSPPFSFAVQAPNPLPDVTGLSPAQAMVGDGAFGLTVIGSGFVPGSTVLWNGEDRTTGFINEFMLAATIRASDTLAVGTAFVSVLNPAPGGGQSLSARVFTIVYPAPTMQLLEPASVWAGGPAFTLAVTGSRFTPVSVVQWAGVDRPTVYVSPERLEAQIFAAEIAHPGTPSVRVFTPGPGGGLSAPLPADVRADDVPPVTVVSGLKGVWHRATTKFTLMATDVGLGVEWTYYRLGTVRRPQGRPHGRRPRTKGPLERRHAYGGLLLRGQGGQSGGAQERAGGHRHAAAGHDRGRRQSGARRHPAAQVPHRRRLEPAGPRRPADRQHRGRQGGAALRPRAPGHAHVAHGRRLPGHAPQGHVPDECTGPRPGRQRAVGHEVRHADGVLRRAALTPPTPPLHQGAHKLEVAVHVPVAARVRAKAADLQAGLQGHRSLAARVRRAWGRGCRVPIVAFSV